MPSDRESHKSLGRLIASISRQAQVFIRKRASELGLGKGQFFLLKILATKEDLNQNELTGTLMIDKATTARAIKSLESKGLAIRVVDPEDRRSNRLSLTPKGKKLCAELDEISLELENRLLAGFSQKDRQRLSALLEKLVANAEKVTESD